MPTPSEDGRPRAQLALRRWLHGFKRPRRLSETPIPSSETWSARRLNALASGMSTCTSYLEIGVRHGATLEGVAVPFRWGVDPHPIFAMDHLPQGMRLSKTTSDEFFAELPSSVRFDLAFVDGLHEWEQTYRDIVNTLNHSTPRAIVLVDDVVPSDQYSAIPDQVEALRARWESGGVGHEWHGDVYKAIIAISTLHPELGFCVCDGEMGNPQALIWRLDDSPALILSQSSVARDLLEKVDFNSAFDVSGRPRAFDLVSESEAINTALGMFE